MKGSRSSHKIGDVEDKWVALSDEKLDSDGMGLKSLTAGMARKRI
jgi:hypothetical protein